MTTFETASPRIPPIQEKKTLLIHAIDTASFTEFSQNLRLHLDRLKSTRRPLYITTNGETEAVMLSSATFNELIEKLELAQSLATI